MAHQAPHMTLLQNACREARVEAFVVSPFIKRAAVDMLLSCLKPDIPVTVITRWRIDEVAAGVSDLGVFESLNSRSNSQMRLLDPVHAKYFRLDEVAYFGSANLTLTGLGVRGQAVELLEERPAGRNQEFEEYVLSESVLVTEVMFQTYASVCESFEPKGSDPEAPSEWFPRFRNPAELWDTYSDETYPSASRAEALVDVRSLGIPAGLSKSHFERAVRLALEQQRIVKELWEFAEQPRRFGELRQWVGAHYEVTDNTRSAQTLTRWMTTFLPDQFSSKASPYSEVLRRV